MVNMTPEAVYARLREMSDLSAREESPMPRGVDMSPTAVAARLRDLAELSELCWKLGTGKLEDASNSGPPEHANE